MTSLVGTLSLRGGRAGASSHTTSFFSIQQAVDEEVKSKSQRGAPAAGLPCIKNPMPASFEMMTFEKGWESPWYYWSACERYLRSQLKCAPPTRARRVAHPATSMQAVPRARKGHPAALRPQGFSCSSFERMPIATRFVLLRAHLNGLPRRH